MEMWLSRPRWTGAMLALATTLLIGCAKETGGRVGATGSVSFKGQPLANGTIEFAAENKSAVSGATITGGAYSVPVEGGLVPGSYIVRISAAGETTKAPDAMPGDSSAVVAKELIPPEWNVNSTQKVEVKADGENKFDFQIP